MGLLTSATAGGLAARRLLPWAVAVPVLLAWLCLRGQQMGLYDTLTTAVVSAAAGAGILVAAVLWAAVRLHRIDLARGRAEDRLRESDERFRGTLDGMMEGCQIIGRDWRYLYVNEAAAAHARRRKKELLGRTMMDCYPGIEGTEMFASLRRCMETGEAGAFENEFSYPDGSRAWFVLSIEPVREGVFVLSLDVSERRRAVESLRESEQQYRLLFDSNPHPMWVYADDTLAFLAVNDAALDRYGWTREEFLGMTIKDVRPADDVPRLLAVIEQHRSERRPVPPGSSGTWTHRRKDGTAIDVELAASPILFHGREAWLTLVTEVTEKRRLEARLQQAQKMEAVGQLAGGIAHDFNNLLGVILGFGDLLARDLKAHHRGAMRLREIRKAAQRAATLTRQLLAFSRKQVLQPTVLDVNEALRDIERMLMRLIGEDIEFVTRYAADLGHVKADPSQLDQVVVNLAVNARDAMPSGGKLIIETVNVDLDEAYARTRPDVQAGPYVMLAISDTGHGMSLETQARAFEPFFTTKGPGVGTGLGLATVHGIVKQSGGHIAVYSEPGRGTTFKVFLPRVEEPLTALPAAIEPALAHGSETVLVVEDAEGLRAVVGEMLAADGYAVLTAADPAEALERARAHAGPIHCLLTDVVMPYMNGRELADRLRLDYSDLKVVFMSGYADGAIVQHGLVEAGIPFIQKPFTALALLRRLRQVLVAPSAIHRGDP